MKEEGKLPSTEKPAAAAPSNNAASIVGEEDAKHPMQLFFEAQDAQEEESTRASAGQSVAVARAAPPRRPQVEQRNSPCIRKDAAVAKPPQISSSSRASIGAFAVEGPGIDASNQVILDVETTNTTHVQDTSRPGSQETDQGSPVTSARPVTIQAVDSFLVEHATLADEENQKPADQLGATGTESHNSSSDVYIDLMDVKIVPEQTSFSRTRTVTYWVGWAGLAFLLVAIITLLAVFLSPSPSSGEGKSNDPLLALESQEESLQDVLHPPFDSTLSYALKNAIQDIGSPHYKANQWILQDPYLESYSVERLHQRFHYAWVYFAFDGDNWLRNDNWLSYEVSECEWFTQQESQHNLYDEYPVCDEEENLLKLNLAENNLRGTLPLLLDFIPTLKIVNLGDNQIEGKPLGSANLPALEVEILSNNLLSGNIESNGEFHMFNLRVVRLDGNDIQTSDNGIVYHLLPKLEIMNVTKNKFSGSIPSSVKYLSRLQEWLGGSNLLTGSFPTEIGMVPSVEKIDVSNNVHLVGTLPSEMGLLTNLQLLDISMTSITGAVPAPLCERVGRDLLTLKANCTLVECC